jgi:hypothetical protein
MATRVNAAVPTIVERIPPSRPISFGDSRKKLRWRTGKPSLRIWKTIMIMSAMVDRAPIQIRVFAID